MDNIYLVGTKYGKQTHTLFQLAGRHGALDGHRFGPVGANAR